MSKDEIIVALRGMTSRLNYRGEIMIHHMTAPDRMGAYLFKQCMATPHNINPYLLHDEYIEILIDVGARVSEEILQKYKITEKISNFYNYRSINKEEVKNRFLKLNDHECFDLDLSHSEATYNRFYSFIKAELI